MTPRHETSKSLKITAISVAEAARILATAYGRRVTEEQVREVIEAWLTGRLAESVFAMPGCGRKHTCQRRRNRGNAPESQ